MKKREELIEKIKDMLRKDTRGLTIQEISEKTKTSRITTALALANMEGGGIIEVREIGNCKLHYLKK